MIGRLYRLLMLAALAESIARGAMHLWHAALPLWHSIAHQLLFSWRKSLTVADEKSSPFPTSTKLATTPQFCALMGYYVGLWSGIELTTDFAICKFMKTTPKEVHLITSGMMFGRKSRLLADLIGRSKHPRKAAILGAFNRIRGESKRDIFIHSYQWSDSKSVKFVERSIAGEFKAKEHPFTFEEFEAHIQSFANAANEFYFALKADPAEVQVFAHAALSLNRKSKRSRGKPKRKA